MDRPNNRAELVALARDAACKITPALAVFRELARRAGYEGRRGGIHLPGGEVTLCCASWVDLAGQVLDPERYLTQDRIVAALGLEPECREGNDPPHPIGAPGCVLNGWGDSGPSVRLTTMRSSQALPEATDAEVLQLLTVLDAGGSVHRALYQEWGVLDAGPFRLNLDAVNRAARDAVRFALARQTFANHEYTLTAEPVHLDAGNGHSACGFPLAGYTIRHRVTTDPSKVTHERCLTT